MLSPIKVTPFKDELLSSWIVRLALANGTDPLSLSGAIFPSQRVWSRDFDKSLNVEFLKALSNISGIPISALTKLTLENHLSSILTPKSKNNAVWPWVIPLAHRNRVHTNGLHFCPECLREKNVYFKRDWRISWNTCCTDHKLNLQLGCPKCNTAFSPHLVTYDKPDFCCCVHCGFDLRAVVQKEVDPEIVYFQGQLNRLLSDNTPEYPWKIKSKTEFFATLNSLTSFIQKTRSSQSKHLFQYLDINDSILNSQTSFSNSSLKERQLTVRCCFRMFSLQLDELIKLLKDAKVFRSNLRPTLHGYSSQTIKTIKQQLPSYKTYEKPNYQKSSQEIHPRSRDEVEKLMDEIRCFL
ncbi:MAG: TniQ family protein [Hydrogenovibrio sp.]